ncbi:MAG: UDP-N-acetylmuramate dehydrogenase [Magnetococcales bacterium]|nr:UDP-N-acetylmuramate dehydrogenase [Magnetococcales bacterium]
MADDPFPGFLGRVEAGVPLAPRTTWRIGGPARWLVAPADAAELTRLLQRLPPETPRMALGGGSNLLVDDAGFDGAVIDLTPGFAHAARLEEVGDGVTIVAGAGLELRALAHWARRQGLSGLEFAAGIPGTVGGALRMNAGAYGGDIASRLEPTAAAEALDGAGSLHRLTLAELGLGYRSGATPTDWIFTQARFRLTPDDPEAIRRRMSEFNRRRVASQPLAWPSAGSVFRNPPGGPMAWELIAAAGLRGASLGGARISEKHGNFFINQGGASARDMRQLIALARRRVEETSGARLTLEVKILSPRGLAPEWE